MEENKKIDEFISTLAELGQFLAKIKFRNLRMEQFETSNKAVDKLIGGFNFSPWNGEPEQQLGADAALQLNRSLKRERYEIANFFTEKEFKTMPKLKDLSYRYKVDDGIHEFRYRRNGINKSFSNKDLKIAKRRALEFCRQLNGEELAFLDKDVSFNVFADEYMNSVKRKNVAAQTFKNDYNRFENYILPAFKKMRLKEVKAPFIQRFLNGILDTGHNRTAEALYYILKSILDYAVNNDCIIKNPMAAVQIPLHQRTVGKALRLSDEKAFMQRVANTPYAIFYAVLLYTGCRPCELDTVTLETEGFLTFRNRKQKRGAVVYKEIPITPMLAPYIDKIRAALPLKQPQRLGDYFTAKFAPGYRLYDLRHTFATRCQTCGVPQEVVQVWLGHKAKSLIGSVYTHFPPEYMLEQAKKVRY